MSKLITDISSSKLIGINTKLGLNAVNLEKKKQEAVEEYNKSVYVLNDDFKDKEFKNNVLIVKLFKDDYLVRQEINSNVLSDIEVKKSNKIFMETEGGKTKLIDNPLAYILKGVIHAKDNKITEFNVGDVVELSVFDLQTNMYYTDKNKIDSRMEIAEIIAGANPYKNFKGYAKIHPSLVECIIK